MPTSIRNLYLVLLTFSLVPVAAAADYFQVTTLAPDLFMLSTDQGSYSNNSLVFTGEDGVLLVDTHHDQDKAAFQEYVENLGFGVPRYIISTHRHVEHIGGNALFGPTPTIIGHHLLPEKLRSGTFLFNEYPPDAYPDITVADSLEIHFNGEIIRVVDIGGSHDDNELMVHFTRRGVAHISSVVNGFNFPSVDSDGDALQFEAQVRRIMTLLPRDVRLVSGHHGQATGYDFTGTWEQLPAYADMMRATVDIVRRSLDDGMTAEEMQTAGIIDEYESYAGSYVDTNGWIGSLVHFMTDQGATGEDICQPLYQVWKADGAAAAVDRYRELLRDEEDRYDFGEYILVSIGSKLYSRELYEDANAFVLGSADIYPDAAYAYYAHYLAAKSYQKLNRNEMALEQCRESLRLEPEFESASTLLSELSGD